MRILFISHYLAQNGSGASELSKNHLTILKRIFSDELVTVVSLLGWDGKNRSDVDYNFTISNNKLVGLKNIIMGHYISIDKKIIKSILDIIKLKHIDVVFIDDSIYGDLVYEIKRSIPNVTVITFYHDIKLNLARQWLYSQPLKRIPLNLRLMSNEKKSQEYSDYDIVLNDRENEIYKCFFNTYADYKLPIVVNSKTINSYQNKERKEYSKLNLLFVGAYYEPNINGLKWFVNNVLPYLNNAFLTVVGNGMDKLDYSTNNLIKIHGYVKKLDHFYNESDVVISPIFEGAGMKVKTAEAFSYGKLYVGTTESLVGYEVGNELINKFVFECNASQEFIQVLNNLQAKKTNSFNMSVYDYNLKNFSLNNNVKKLSIWLKSININIDV